jgi:hypothetical protein
MARYYESNVPGRLHERSMNISERLKTVNNQECWIDDDVVESGMNV